MEKENESIINPPENYTNSGLEDVTADRSDKIDDEEKDHRVKKILELARKRQFVLQKIQNAEQKLHLFINNSSEKEFFDNLKEAKDPDKKKFMDLLDIIEDKSYQVKHASKQSSDEILSLNNQIEEKEQFLAELDNTFKETVEKTALNAVHSETGEKMSPQDVKEMLLKEEKILKSLRESQFYSIQKRYSLDLAKKGKTNLCEGPLDFTKYEMMCIEIQNNKEIIQSISEEIKNLTKKSLNIINILSHLEQKLHLAQEEKVKASEREKMLENELNQMRDELFAERMKYNKMKHESKELQHKFILLQHPRLIEDYNRVKQENEDAVKELEELKNIYNQEMKSMKE